MTETRQPYRADPTATMRTLQQGSPGGSPGTYITPEQAGPDHGEPLLPLSTASRVFRVVVALALGVLGILAVIRIVALSITLAALWNATTGTPDAGSTTTALVGNVVLAVVFLTYPAIAVRRLVRARRRRRS